MTESILVTGGMGYLGRRIVLKLLEETEFKLRLTTHKIKRTFPEWPGRIHTIPVDILSESDLALACRDIQSIIHLAALNENESALDPERALFINGLGTLKLLQAAEKAGVKRFIYFSTIRVYGTPLVGKITEKTLPRPIHPHPITHRTAEDFVLNAHDRKALCGLVLRLSNAIGPPAYSDSDRWTLVVNDLCRQAVTCRKMELRTSGLQMRDFITLEDVARAVLHFLRLPTSQCGDGLFNLGGENPMRIIQVAERISSRSSKILGFTPEIIRPAPRPNESLEELNYCIDKLKATGFRLQGKVDEEIDQTLKFCVREFGKKSAKVAH